MRIKLISEVSINNEITINTETIIKHLNASEDADLILFSEAFLNGFDGLTWNYETDLNRSILNAANDIVVIKEACLKNNCAVGFGYFERVAQDIYCSYMIIDKEGNIINNYQRISTGWKEIRLTTNEYKEGIKIIPFNINGFNGVTLLCGDLWDDDIKNKLLDIIVDSKIDFLIWPNHLDYSKEEFEKEMKIDYAYRVKDINIPIFLINDISDTSPGGAVIFKNGNIISKTKIGSVDTLKYDL